MEGAPNKKEVITHLDESAKRDFDAMFELYKLTWSQFNERRSYEVKITLTFWTALAACIAGSLQLSSVPEIPGGKWILLVLAFGAVWLHKIWCKGIGRAQRAERLIAFFWEKEIQKLLKRPFDQTTQIFLDSLKPSMGLLRNWTYKLQLSVTAFLAVTLVLTNWSRFEDKREAQQRMLEIQRLSLEVKKLEREIVDVSTNKEISESKTAPVSSSIDKDLIDSHTGESTSLIEKNKESFIPSVQSQGKRDVGE